MYWIIPSAVFERLNKIKTLKKKNWFIPDVEHISLPLCHCRIIETKLFYFSKRHLFVIWIYIRCVGWKRPCLKWNLENQVLIEFLLDGIIRHIDKKKQYETFLLESWKQKVDEMLCWVITRLSSIIIKQNRINSFNMNILGFMIYMKVYCFSY